MSRLILIPWEYGIAQVFQISLRKICGTELGKFQYDKHLELSYGRVGELQNSSFSILLLSVWELQFCIMYMTILHCSSRQQDILDRKAA